MNTDSKYKALDSRYDRGMRYCRSGKSGIMMSSLTLGFWQNFGGIVDYSNSKAMAEYAFDHGITCFDLANNYGPPYGSAEITFGKLMKDSFRPYRDEMFITTKAGYDMWAGPYGNWGSRKYLLSSLDQSLKRMGLDYVDLFYSHRFDPETPLDETLQALVDAVRQGKALYAGISNYPIDAARYAVHYLKSHDVPCLCYQGRMSLLDRRHDGVGSTLDVMNSLGVGFTAFSPLAEGLLTDRYLEGIPTDSRMYRRHHLTEEKRTPKMVEALKKLNAIAVARGETLASMALAWVLKHNGVTSVIVGVSKVSQLEADLKALSSPDFTVEEISAIEEAMK